MRSSTNTVFVKITAIASCICFIISLVMLSLVGMYKLSGKNDLGSAFYASAEPLPVLHGNTYNITNPDSEVRGVYIASIVNINFPSEKGISASQMREELDTIVETVIEANLNAIYFQVRPTSDALYDSDIFPTSYYLTGEEGSPLPSGFDPLEYIVEIAHAKGIKVHAWVNPYRITYGTAGKPNTDINALSDKNPARQHPEWVVPYADGKLYYNPGIPEVRELIVSGIEEILLNYPVDGIIFDDYFYPYPVDGAEFDDAKEYLLYGHGMSLEDWRRENVNLLIKECYYAIKNINNFCTFGVSPFGIWQNDNGSNGGSKTNGFEGYHQLYCAPIAWAEGGYIDYISPQIYWEFSTNAAPYGELVRWWNAELSQYPEVDFIISHAAYKSADYAVNEMQNQVEFARSEKTYKGSIMYGYEAISKNEGNVKDQLKNVYSDPIIYTDVVSNNAEVYIESPADGTVISDDFTYLIGKCDPTYPLYFKGRPVSYTKNGYFSVYTELKNGLNTFEFIQNGKTYTHKITKSKVAASTYSKMDSFAITSVSPSQNSIYRAGDTVELSVTAPAGSQVSAKFGDSVVTLSPTIDPPSESTYMKEVYVGNIKLDTDYSAYKISDCGSISFTAVRGNERATKSSGAIEVAGSSALISVEVVKDDAELKKAVNSWYYDDYCPTAVGMTDSVTRFVNGYYQLRMGAFVSPSAVIRTDKEIPLAKLGHPTLKIYTERTYIEIPCDVAVPANGHIEDGIFELTLYNVDTDTAKSFVIRDKDMLFSDVSVIKDKEKSSVTYALTLRALENYYGFDYEYKNGCVVFTFRNPDIIPASDKPLYGKTIVLDSGHGGTDIGAAGADLQVHEAQMNYMVALSAKEKLEAWGATVLLTRGAEETLDIMDRVSFISLLEPDICISVHQNSIGYGTDNSRVHGTVGLFYAYSGYMLNSAISDSLSFRMSRILRSTAGQRLAMVRNEEFPSCLIEVGFMTCPEEVEQMVYGNGIERAAEGIADGVVENA
ncbi:MAG: hypothetical protein E7623_07715, partial [Ruminococcaceae bacterium]|nr:hypothetical protein [Oscillospiraceae bacterium]